MTLEELLQKVAIAVRNETVARGGELPDIDLFGILDTLFPDDAGMFVLKETTVANLIRSVVSISQCADLEASALAEDALEKYRSSLVLSANPTVH